MVHYYSALYGRHVAFNGVFDNLSPHRGKKRSYAPNHCKLALDNVAHDHRCQIKGGSVLFAFNRPLN